MDDHFDQARNTVASWSQRKREIGHRLDPQANEDNMGTPIDEAAELAKLLRFMGNAVEAMNRQAAELNVKQALIETQSAEIDKLRGSNGNAFVDGAAWWEHEQTGATMWPEHKNRAAEEAKRREYVFRDFDENAYELAIERLRAELAEVHEAYTRLLEENKGMLQSGGYDHLSKQRDKAEQEAMSRLHAAEEWQKRARRFERDAAFWSGESSTLRALRDATNAECGNLKAQLTEAAQEISGLHEAINGLGKENDRLIAELEKANQETRAVREQVDKKRAQINILVEEAAALRKEDKRIDPAKCCRWTFKSEECGYAGAWTECDGSFESCKSLGNLARFGGQVTSPEPKTDIPTEPGPALKWFRVNILKMGARQFAEWIGHPKPAAILNVEQGRRHGQCADLNELERELRSGEVVPICPDKAMKIAAALKAKYGDSLGDRPEFQKPS